MNVAAPPEIDGLDTAQCMGVIERVCSSAEVRRAARLRDFLHYVSRHAVESPGVPVTEQEIGIKVFGRPADYDTSIDNIVRVNASELRKRIAAYFTSEGAHEPIWFEIPRGSYTPRFLPHTEPKPKPEPVILTPPPISTPIQQEPAKPRIPTFLLTTVLFTIIALVAACTWLILNLRSARKAIAPWRSETALNNFWSPILDGPRTTDVVLADTSFEFAQDVLGHRISLKDYLSRSYEDELRAANLPPALQTEATTVLARSDGSFGDFAVAHKILSLAPDTDHLRLDYARTLRPRALKTDNLVIIGSSYSNPWTSLFEDILNFLVTTGSDRQQMSVENRNPHAGEQKIYTAPTGAVDSIGYSVIASLPGEGGQGDVLLIEGTTAEATEAAGEFLTSNARLNQLQSLMHVQRLTHFEVLLRTTKLAGTPLSAEIIGIRQY
jgi:hypothetical protein